MYRDCPECFGTGYVWFDAHSHYIDLDMALCPVCDGEGVLERDETDEEGEGDDDGHTVS